MPILLFHLELSASIRSISEFPKRSETDGRYTPSEKCREKDTISEKVKARVTLLGTQHIEKKIGIWALARNFGPLWPALARNPRVAAYTPFSGGCKHTPPFIKQN